MDYIRGAVSRYVLRGLAPALFCLNILIVWPYIALDYSAHPWGNDFGYIAIARLFREQPWTWNALQYCGAPFQYLYPPLFHAMVATLPIGLGRSFHVVSGVSYALMPVGLYYLALALTRSRLAALLAGVWYSVLASPICVFPWPWRDIGRTVDFAPLTFAGLVQYDEGPHFLAFALALFAMAFAWRNSWRIAACFGALALLTNTIGALGLLMMLMAFGLARVRESGLVRAGVYTFTLGGTVLGLSAFWITPGFLITNTLANRVVIASQAAPAPWTIATFAIILAGLSLMAAAMFFHMPSTVSFILNWIAIAGMVLAAFAVSGVSLVPLANRYAPEWNAALILGTVLLVAQVSRRNVRRLIALAIICILVWSTRGFLMKPWKGRVEAGEKNGMISYQVADWLERNAGSSRVFATGEIENALNAWSGVRQVGGSFAGMSNMLVVGSANQMQGSCGDIAKEKEITHLWLQALNVDYAVVGGAASMETYHWLAHPDVFDGYETVWSNGRGDSIVRVSGGNAEAVVVDMEALRRLPKIRSTADIEFLRAYVAWAQGVRPARVDRRSNHNLMIHADVHPGEAVLVKSSFDRGWRDSLGSIERDPIGFLLIRPSPETPVFELRFGFSWDVWAGILVTVVTLVSLCFGMPRFSVAVSGVLIFGVAYLVLALHEPPGLSAAVSSFQDNHLPMIRPQGLVLQGPGRLAVIGQNFGGPNDSVRVLIGGRDAEISTRSAAIIHAETPPGINQDAAVTVLVNGCRGNSFLLPGAAF